MKGLRGTTSQGAGFRHHAGHKVTLNWTGSVLGVSKARSTCILALRGRPPVREAFHGGRRCNDM